MDLYSKGKTKKWKESNLGYLGLSSVFTMHSLFHFHLSVSPVLFLIKFERDLADRMSLFSKCANSHQMTSYPQSETGNYTHFTSVVTSEKNRQESRLNVHSKYMVVYSDSRIMLENIVNSRMYPLPLLCDPNCPTLQFFPPYWTLSNNAINLGLYFCMSLFESGRIVRHVLAIYIVHTDKNSQWKWSILF